jgi:antirestriction protein ArdC
MESRNLYQEVTDRVLNELKKGVIPWAKPWKGGVAVSHTTGGAYTFLNQMLISFSSTASVVGGEYLTFKQVKKEGGSVRKGEKSALIMFYCTDYQTKEKDDDGEEYILTHEYDRPVLKAYHVFEVSQCEGIERRHTIKTAAEGGEVLPISERAEAAAHAYLDGAGIPLVQRISDTAAYNPTLDKIVMPSREQFNSVARYYSTLFHEMTHSTGAEKRLKRDLSGRFGSKKYAREELVAEMGAAYLSAILGTADDESLKATSSYIENWSKALTEDNALVVYAASRAQRAAEYIMSYSESK